MLLFVWTCAASEKTWNVAEATPKYIVHGLNRMNRIFADRTDNEGDDVFNVLKAVVADIPRSQETQASDKFVHSIGVVCVSVENDIQHSWPVELR